MREYGLYGKISRQYENCLADALKRCMKRAPLEKITVGE